MKMPKPRPSSSRYEMLNLEPRLDNPDRLVQYSGQNWTTHAQAQPIPLTCLITSYHSHLTRIIISGWISFDLKFLCIQCPITSYHTHLTHIIISRWSSLLCIQCLCTLMQTKMHWDFKQLIIKDLVWNFY